MSRSGLMTIDAFVDHVTGHGAIAVDREKVHTPLSEAMDSLSLTEVLCAVEELAGPQESIWLSHGLTFQVLYDIYGSSLIDSDLASGLVS